MSTSYRTTRRVEFADTDAARIAHFSAFLRWMEEVEHEYLRHRGLSVMMAHGTERIGWPRVAVAAEFQSAVVFEDLLDVELKVERIGTKSVTYAFTFHHRQRLVATGRATVVCCRMVSGAPPEGIAIPPQILARLTDPTESACPTTSAN